MGKHANTIRIHQFIVEQVPTHADDIAKIVQNVFKISRQAANAHLSKLEQEGVLISVGSRQSKRWSLNELDKFEQIFAVKGLQEDIPWRENILPLLDTVPNNVVNICNYGFTEILNNVLDHSESEQVLVKFWCTAGQVSLFIRDYGIGIFKKIKLALGLPDELEAIQELAKGKFTTDPKRHSGEGIFFTSRIFDWFTIQSGSLYFSHTRPDDDWLIETVPDLIGTAVRMAISRSSTAVLKELFDKFTIDDEYAFAKTHIPVSLLKYGAGNVVSRSQAKRLLSRFEQFREVILDFSGVDEVGQAFADEVFRVYASEHPETIITPIHTTQAVQSMIRRAIAARR